MNKEEKDKKEKNELRNIIIRKHRRLLISKIISFVILFIFIYGLYEVILWKKLYLNYFSDVEKENVSNFNTGFIFPVVLGDIKINDKDKEYLTSIIKLLNSKNIKIIQIEYLQDNKYQLTTNKNYYIKLDTSIDIYTVNNNFINIYIDTVFKELLLSDNKLSYIDLGYTDKAFYKTLQDVKLEAEDKLKINNSDILVTGADTNTNNIDNSTTNNIVNIDHINTVNIR
ncbi:MAG: hypothetical protein QM532_01820 [Cyanobium sp. MAG06]|nr:hypothetical protein [Cyanobium sp. MAG06]